MKTLNLFLAAATLTFPAIAEQQPAPAVPAAPAVATPTASAPQIASTPVSLSLKAHAVASQSTAKDYNKTHRGTFYTRDVTHSETISMSVRNLGRVPVKATMVVTCLERPTAGGKVVPYDSKSFDLDLGPGLSDEKTYQSKTVSETDTKRKVGSTTSGSKIAGWVVTVKVDDKVVAIDASNPEFKQRCRVSANASAVKATINCGKR